ncbi:MAG TPA: hypothetical protein VJS89_00350 [Gammaproteobacteria bacterium]|nr:hypothetical protein [Gammaproteobacteria bacterium]
MRNPQEYLGALARLPRPYRFTPQARDPADQREADVLEANTREFASANLHHLLPEIPLREHPKIIDEILLHRLMAELDEEGLFLLDNLHIEDPRSVLPAAKNTPVIFCTFHFGSYRLINMLLLSRSFNYLLPVEDQVYTVQKAIFMDHAEGYKKHFHSTPQLVVVNAEEPTAALVMARKARAGWSLLTYIDGNTGVQGAARKDAKMLKVPLLGRPIYARKGIAFLSHFLKLPIVPVFCEITGQVERRLIIHDPIRPGGDDADRDAYCQAATEQLYALLGSYLKKSPSQWLGWLDMQQYLDLDATTPLETTEIMGSATDSEGDEVVAQRLVFNHERFGFIVRDGERVLLDKLTYEFLSVPESVLAVLDACREPVAVTRHMPEEYKETIEQLLSLNLLSPVTDSMRRA